MKRTLSLLLAVLMIAACFAVMVSCGDDATTTAGTTTAAGGTTTAQGTTKAGSEKVTTTKKVRTTREKPEIVVPKEWDGDGEGTEASPYLIKTADDLDALATKAKDSNFAGKVFQLANDIVYNDTSKDGWADAADAKVFAMLGTDINFAGTIDGNGHCIEGMLIKTHLTDNASAATQVGFIAKGAGCTVKNLAMINEKVIVTTENADIKGSTDGSIAGLVAIGHGVITISNCVVVGEVNSAVTLSGGLAFGWINAAITIENTLIVGTAKTGHGIFGSGAQAGSALNGVIAAIPTSGNLGDWAPGNAFAVSGFYGLEGGAALGGFGGSFGAATDSGALSAEKLTGAAAAENCKGIDFTAAWQTNEGFLPCPKVFANNAKVTKIACPELPAPAAE